MTTANKAGVAGVGTFAATPVIAAISWALQKTGMPPDIATGLAQVMAALAVAVAAYYVPDAAKVIATVESGAPTVAETVTLPLPPVKKP